MALIKGLDSTFYSFDSHARNYIGIPDPNGTAVVMKCHNIVELEKYICSLSEELNTNAFEIVEVQLHENRCKNAERTTLEKNS